MAQPVDRAYTVLLSHLHKPSSNLSLDTLQSLITHFLARTPSPTPLSATVISSPLFRPFSHAKLSALTTAFRHAVYARYKQLKEEPAGIFTQSLRVRMSSWTRAVVSGFNGGQGVIRLVGAGGVLLGLEDLKSELDLGDGRRSARVRTEEEVVIALAEVMEVYGGRKVDVWESEFRPETEHDEVDVLSLSLLFACQFTSLIDSERLTALPLGVLVTHLLSTIERAFMGGRFLESLKDSCFVDADQKLSLAIDLKAKERHTLPYDGSSAYKHTSRLSIDLRTISSSTVFASIAALSRTTAQILPLLVESQPRDGWRVLEDVLKQLNAMATTIELHWALSPLVMVESEDNISSDSQEIAKALWTVLKTFLFATVMISQASLTALVYARNPFDARDVTPTPTAESLALLALDVLHRLAFVISKFGGIATGGFAELKKVFYTALDILSADPALSDTFVQGLSRAGSVGSSNHTRPPSNTPYERSVEALRLTCIEQLVAVLSPVVIESHVFPLCLPHLNDSTHRETYESAHSVVLALFAVQARKHTVQRDAEPTFVEKLVPFYAQCLLENSADGKLNTTQLRLAYNALVSSASTFSNALASYCLLELEDALDAASTDAPRQHRLRLTLVSCLSALPLHLLARALDRVRRIIISAESEQRDEIVKEVLAEIMERVGDLEKELAMQWWAENETAFAGYGVRPKANPATSDTNRKGKEVAVVSRL